MDNGQIAMRRWAISPKSLVPVQINIRLDQDHSRVLFGVF